MRLATILPRASLEPVPVAASPDGTWIELAGLIGRVAPRMKPTLAWLMTHDRPSPERVAAWKGPRIPLILAAVLGVVAYLLALVAYSFAPLSYSGAIREVSVVIGAFFGWLFLEEPMGGTRVLGSVVIFAGILTIALFA